MLVISGSESKDQVTLGPYSPDSSCELRVLNSLSPMAGSSAGWSRVPGWAVDLGRVIWGGVVVWDRVGLFAISPSLP